MCMISFSMHFLDVKCQYHLHNVAALSTFFEFVSKVAAAATWLPDKNISIDVIQYRYI